MMRRVRFWRWTAVGLLGVILLLVFLIAVGWFDPQPRGTLGWQKVLPPQRLTAGSPEVMWLDEVATAAYSVRATAVYQSGAMDISYGLILGHESDYLAVAVSPLGYVAVWQGEQILLPWQTWPHVRSGSEPNEIWVAVSDGRLTIRINREILWAGDADVAGGVGVIGESFGETAVIQFQSVQLFMP